jgi:hypothetical protein
MNHQRKVAARLRHEGTVAAMRDGRRQRSAQFADKRDKLEARRPKHRSTRGGHWA